MTKFYTYLNENYNNWTFPNNETIDSDFLEYSKKEQTKWKRRADVYGFRFPIFSNKQEFKQELKNGKIIKITESWIDRIDNLSDLNNIEDLRELVQSYKRPRDIDSIIRGLENNEKLPYPIVLKGNRGYHMLAGNTRINTARIMDITPKAILIDVSEEKTND